MYCLEEDRPYSVILHLPVLLLAFRRELILFRRPLRLAVGNALLFHADPPTAALCMGLGVKFYSRLPDGTLLITSDFRTHAVPRPGAAIVRLSIFDSIEAAWAAHRDRVGDAFGQSRFPPRRPGFREYVEMSHREEDLSQYM